MVRSDFYFNRRRRVGITSEAPGNDFHSYGLLANNFDYNQVVFLVTGQTSLEAPGRLLQLPRIVNEYLFTGLRCSALASSVGLCSIREADSRPTQQAWGHLPGGHQCYEP